MGKIILCKGKRAVTPYVTINQGICIYSIEELCYFVYHNIETVSDDLYRKELVDFIRDELGISDRAEFIDKLRQDKAGIKDMVVSILCSTDYYTEKEIKSLIAEMDVFYQMKPVQRLKRNADRLMQMSKYKEAAALYRRIQNSGEMAELTIDEQGSVMHNIAVSDVTAGAFAAAAEGFMRAYEHSRFKESLKQYLFALKISKQEELYARELDKYIRVRSFINEIEDEYNRAMESFQYTLGYDKLLLIIELNKNGFASEHAEKKKEMMTELKTSILL